VRWHIPVLRDNAALAAAVTRRLVVQDWVRRVATSDITGNLLLEFSSDRSHDEASHLVRAALDDALLRPERSPDAASSGAMATPRTLSGEAHPMVRLYRRLEPHTSLVRRAAATSFLNRLLDSSPPILMGAGLDIVTIGRTPLLRWLGLKTVSGQLVALGGIGLALWAADAALEYMHRRSAAELANCVRDELRNELYSHLQTLDLAQFESRDVSAWLGIIEGDLSRIHGFIKDGTDPVVAIAANGLAMTASLFSLSPGFAAAQLLMIPPVVVASTELLGPLRDRLIAAHRDGERLSAVLHGNLSSLPTIQSFNAQPLESAHVAEAGRLQVASAQAAHELSARYVPSLILMVGTSFMATLVYGGFQVAGGRLIPSAYNIAGATQLRMLAAVGQFGTSLDSYQRTTVSLNRVFEVLDITPTVHSVADAVPLSGLTRDIVFDGVEFGYDTDRQVLRKLSLRVPAGATVGIVGSSGAGKSTVLKLLLRFYDVQGGAIRFDGVDLRELRLTDLRSSVAMVAQDLAVFAGTVRENIAYANRNASADAIRRAAELAEAHDFIDALPDGFDTVVGHGAHSLSTGQRQRLAIARAFLANRPILLFDEATSSLDYQTEAAIQRSLREVTAGRTTIIVAHRLATIRHADLIYVLDEGVVREQGRHDDLLAADGVYASMWRVQTGEHSPPRTPTRRRSRS
jgi:ATP-binding cassette subfamily B protein